MSRSTNVLCLELLKQTRTQTEVYQENKVDEAVGENRWGQQPTQ